MVVELENRMVPEAGVDQNKLRLILPAGAASSQAPRKLPRRLCHQYHRRLPHEHARKHPMGDGVRHIKRGAGEHLAVMCNGCGHRHPQWPHRMWWRGGASGRPTTPPRAKID